MKNDYQLHEADSQRIKCSDPDCGKQATVGMNNGGAPFFYWCDEHAAEIRLHERLLPWQMTFPDYVKSMHGKRVKKIAPFNREMSLRLMYNDRVCSALQAAKPVPAIVCREIVAWNPYIDAARHIRQARPELFAAF